jgi:hypothetical protein
LEEIKTLNRLTPQKAEKKRQPLEEKESKTSNPKKTEKPYEAKLKPPRKKRDFRKRVKAKSYFSLHSHSSTYSEKTFSCLNRKRKQNLNLITRGAA